MTIWTVARGDYDTEIVAEYPGLGERRWRLTNDLQIALPEGITKPVDACTDGQLIQFCLNVGR